MKKISGLMLTTAIVMFFTSACRKDENGVTITKVINIEINANNSYTFDVPHAGDADDLMQITKQASHFLKSQITPSSNGNVAFAYTPELNYVGTDEVLISNGEGAHGNGGKGGHGNCGGSGKHHDDTTIYDFKINIKGTTTRSGH